MHRSTSTALSALAAAVLGFASASAAAADLTGTATPTLTPIQLSSPAQPTFAQYDVVITNPSQPTITGWRFVGRTNVLGGTSTATFFAPGSDVNCAAPNSPTEVVCSFPPLASGASRSFKVAFSAPTDGTEIDLSWRAFWDESGNGGNDGFRAAQATALQPPSPDTVSSVVPSNTSALTFFTGVGTATPADPWVTRVTVPANLSVSTQATVVETVTPGGCAADLLTCNTSTLTIPGSFSSLLEITLRRDASTIAKGARIDSARIYYQHTTSSATIEVPSCIDTSFNGPLPQSGIPCEDRSLRKAYPKKGTPKSPVPAGFEGDWEFVIRALDNGRYTN